MNRPAAPQSLFGAIARLAVFNPSGLSAIGNTPESFLASLSPLVAFLLVGAGLEVVTMGWREGVADGLTSLCVLLGQPVYGQLLARLFRRQDRWLRYATAMNWCQLAIPFVAMLFIAIASVAGGPGAAAQTLLLGIVGTIVLYALGLNWFLAWRGLELPGLQAVAFVLGVMVLLVVTLAVPMAARYALTGSLPPPSLAT